MIRIRKTGRFAAILAMLPLCASGQALNLLTEEAYPFQYLDNQRLTGMAVEVVNEVFKRSGFERKDELLSWKDAYDRTQIYPNTCLYSTARTENRERLFRWVGPIVENKWAVFAKQGFKDSLGQPKDLKQYRVGVLKGDAKERYLQDLAVTFISAESDDAANPPKLTLDRMEPNKIDLWVTGYYAGGHIAAKTGVKGIVPLMTLQSSQNYLACHTSVPKASIDKMQAALDAMKRDGTHAKIVAKYDVGRLAH